MNKKQSVRFLIKERSGKEKKIKKSYISSSYIPAIQSDDFDRVIVPLNRKSFRVGVKLTNMKGASKKLGGKGILR